MNHRHAGKVQTPVVLLGFLAIAAGTFLLAKRVNQASREEQIQARKHLNPDLFLLKEDDIDKVVIERGDTKIVLERKGPRWQVTEPIQVLADTSRVNDVIRSLRNMERIPKSEPIIGSKTNPLKLADYQLDKPSIGVTLYKGSSPFGLLVGEETPLGGEKGSGDKATYVKLPDEEIVYLVRPFDLESLKKELKDLRQKQLVTVSRFNADSANLEWGPERKLALEKRQDAKWWLTEPIQDRADATKVGDLIGKLADLKVEADADFIDDNATDLAKYGLDKPRLVAAVGKDTVAETVTDKEKTKAKEKKESDKKKEPQTDKILIGADIEGQEGKVYAKIADQNYVVAISSKVLAELDKQPNDLRSRDLVELNASDVDYLQVKSPAGSVVLAKKDLDWEIYQPKKLRAETAAVSDFVKKIDELEIKEFVDQGDAKEYGLEEPAATVTLYQRGLKTDETKKDETKKDEKKEQKEDTGKDPEPKGSPINVQFGKRDEEKKVVYVRRSDGPGIFAVGDEGLWDSLDRDYLAYRRKQVLSFQEIDVAKVSVRRDGKTYLVERKKEKEGDTKETWRMTEPVDAPADSTGISDLLFDVTRLNAKKFYAEAPADLKPYGLDEPMASATFTMKADGDKPPAQHVLLIGGEVDGGHYAKLGDSDLVFSVEQRVVNDLTAELHDRSILKFDTFKVDGLKLAWPEAKLELANKKPEGQPAKAWTVVGDDAFKLDAKKPQDLINYLANLTTDKFAQYQGDFTEKQGFDKPALVIEVQLEGETSPKTLRVGAKEADRLYASTGEKSGPVALLPDTRLGEILTGPAFFAIPEEKKPEE